MPPDADNGSSSVPLKIQITIDEASDVTTRALEAAGYTPEQAAIITDHLVDAELRGHPFAGLARALSIIEQLHESGLQANIATEVTRSGPAYAHINGHNAVGYLVAREATQLAIDKAKTAGVSVVGANGLWYSGNLAYYAEMATRADLVVLIASNGGRVVAPHGGYEPKFCTNPFCIGFPSRDPDRSVIWDIGTSNIMYAQVRLAERLGIGIPEGAAYDREGNLTTNPLDVLQGALTAWGGYKGSGLAVMVQLLGIAAGSSEPTPLLSDFGYLVIAFDPSVLQSLERVKEDGDKFAEAIRSSKTLPGHGPVRMPFDRSSEARKEARARGWFTVAKEVVDQLRQRGRT